MGAILTQRNFLLTKEYELTDKSLKVRISKPFNFLEEEFSYEQLTSKTKRTKSPNLVAALFALAGLIGIIITMLSHFFEKNGSTVYDIIFYIILFLVLIIINYFTYNNFLYLFLIDNRQIPFFANSPDYKTVNNFIDLMVEEQKKFLLNRYAKADPYLTTEQLSNNLQWLWNRNVINDEELDHLRNQILGNKLDENKFVGFKIGINN